MAIQLKASIIVPAYKAEKTIQKCLDSLLSQSLKKEEYEIIVVDDGSFDNTQKIIEENYQGKVLYIKQENQGPAAARNKGVEFAKSSIIVFTDSDCELETKWLEEMISPFEDNQIGGVQGIYRTKQKKIVAQFVQYEIESRYRKMSSKKYIDFLGTYSSAFRRNIFLENKGFDRNYLIASGEDADFSYRLEKKGIKFLFNQKAICYHLHPESLFKYFKVKFYRGFWRVPLYKNHKDKILNDSYTPFSLKFQISLILFFPFFLILIFYNFKNYFLFKYFFILIYIIIFFSMMLPLIIFISKKNLKLGFLSIFIILGRDLAMVFGLIFGFFKLFIYKIHK